MGRPKKKEEPTDVLKKYNLSLEQEMFCQYFTSATEFFGNGTQSYGAAYNLDLNNTTSYNTARSLASRALTNTKILRRINDLIEASGLNDVHVDKQLFLLVNQNADFKAKLGAIREYNKLKMRITEKIKHEGAIPVTAINIVPVPDDQYIDNENDNNDTTGGDSDGEDNAEETTELERD